MMILQLMILILKGLIEISNKNILTKRLCVYTNDFFEKKDLIRINKSLDNSFEIDWFKNKKGRGAYLKKDFPLIIEALEKRKLNRSFKMNIDQKVYNELIEEVRGNYEKKR